MSVRGTWTAGLLVDPGASKGLIGIDTLRLLVDRVLKPRHLQNQLCWHSSRSVFTGISDRPQRSLGAASFPIGLYGFTHASFHTDVIGGEGSWCPGLIPLATFLRLGCIMLFAYFQNGDGVLGIYNHQQKQWCAQRLLLTDSGHYLLPIDKYKQPTLKDLDQRLNAMIEKTPKNAMSNATRTGVQLHEEEWKNHASVLQDFQ